MRGQKFVMASESVTAFRKRSEVFGVDKLLKNDEFVVFRASVLGWRRRMQCRNDCELAEGASQREQRA